MPIINRIADFHDDMTAWRRDLHRHPETAFEERRTASLVAEKLTGAWPRRLEDISKTAVPARTDGKNGWRGMTGLFGLWTLGGYEDMNDADRLGRDPALPTLHTLGCSIIFA